MTEEKLVDLRKCVVYRLFDALLMKSLTSVHA